MMMILALPAPPPDLNKDAKEAAKTLDEQLNKLSQISFNTY